MSVRNHIAKDLRTPKYRQRVVGAKKGRGSFSRKSKINQIQEKQCEYANK